MFVDDNSCRIIHPRVPGKTFANKVFCDIVLRPTNMYKSPRKMVVRGHIRDEVLGKARDRIFTTKTTEAVVFRAAVRTLQDGMHAHAAEQCCKLIATMIRRIV